LRKDDRNPRRAFIEDLGEQVDLWITEGNLLLIGLDANDNVRTGDVNAMLHIKGLTDVHAAKHPRLQTVTTSNKNQRGTPVDGIRVSTALECSGAGYCGFGELVIGKTDHDLVVLQDMIGWRYLLEGCVLQAWATKQQDYYNCLQR
jgi:hypothetical protein